MTRNPDRDNGAFDRERRRNITSENPDQRYYENRRQPYNSYNSEGRANYEYEEYLSAVGNRYENDGDWYDEADYGNEYYGGDCGNFYGNSHRDRSSDDRFGERRFVRGSADSDYNEDRRRISHETREVERTSGLHPGRQRNRYWDEENGYRSPVSGNRGHSASNYYPDEARGDNYGRSASQHQDRSGSYDTGRQGASHHRNNQNSYRQYESDFEVRRNPCHAGSGYNSDFYVERRNVGRYDHESSDFGRDRGNDDRRSVFSSSKDKRFQQGRTRAQDPRRDERRSR